jgi:hypothetical protein
MFAVMTQFVQILPGRMRTYLADSKDAIEKERHEFSLFFADTTTSTFYSFLTHVFIDIQIFGCLTKIPTMR